MPVANGVPGEEQAIMKLSEGSSGGKNLGKGGDKPGRRGEFRASSLQNSRPVA